MNARASRSASIVPSDAGVDEAHALGGRDQRLDQLGPVDHLGMIVAEVEAVGDGALDGLDHRRMGMAEQQRAVAHAVVDVLVAVDVPLARAARVGDVRRRECRCSARRGRRRPPPPDWRAGRGPGLAYAAR